MKKRLLVLSLIPSLLLTGCSSFSGANPAYRNGDLIYTLTDNPNLFRDVNATQIDALMKSKSDFLLLFSQNGCASCAEFKPVIEQYIKNTNQLVYRYDVKSDDFVTFGETYGERFFPNGMIETPSLFLVNNAGEIEHLSKNMYNTTLMLTNMMKSHLYETNVYSFSRYYPYSEFIKHNYDFYTFIYDRSNESQANMYDLHVNDYITKSEKMTAVIDVMMLTDSDKEKMQEAFHIESFDKLTMHLVSNGEIGNGTEVLGPIEL